MAKRERKTKDGNGGLYFKERNKVGWISSGCTVLDCALGDGWAERRISNIVGDSSSGKTLLAEECGLNFLLKHNTGIVRYHEVESAFDEDYAQTIGFPLDLIEFVEGNNGAPINTVEGFFDSVDNSIVESVDKGVPICYIIDSFDFLTDVAELNRDSESGTYGTKAKAANVGFKKLAAKVASSNLTLVIISQIRDNLSGYGRPWIVSGGRALKFAISQRLFLKEKNKVSKQKDGEQRVYGIGVEGEVVKNKVAPPFRKCNFDIRFYFGIDDFGASVDWLSSLKSRDTIFNDLNIDVYDDRNNFSPRKLSNMVEKINKDGDPELESKVKAKTKEVWRDIETGFLPTRKKYDLSSIKR